MMKVLVISVLIAALLLFICAMIQAGIIARHFKKKQDNGSAKDDIESTRLLCSGCKTGKKSFELDKLSENCPYIDCIKNGECKFYEPF